MKMNEIRARAREIHKMHAGNAWILSIICAFFIGGLFFAAMMLSRFSGLILLLASALVFLPFFFACTMAHRGFVFNNGNLTGRGLLHYYSLYFTPSFNSSYRFFKTFFLTILFDIVLSITAGLVLYLIFKNNAEFVEVIDELTNYLNNGKYEEASKLLQESEIFIRFTNLTVNISTIGSIGFAVWHILKNNYSVSYRIHFPNANPNIVNISYRRFEKMNRNLINKMFYSLNWPILVLFFLGLAIGGVVSALFLDNGFIISVAGASGFLLALFYLPFYFANLEAMDDALFSLYKDNMRDTAKEMAERIKENEQLNEQQLNDIDNFLNRLDESKVDDNPEVKIEIVEEEDNNKENNEEEK